MLNVIAILAFFAFVLIIGIPMVWLYGLLRAMEEHSKEENE